MISTPPSQPVKWRVRCGDCYVVVEYRAVAVLRGRAAGCAAEDCGDRVNCELCGNPAVCTNSEGSELRCEDCCEYVQATGGHYFERGWPPCKMIEAKENED